CPAWAAGGDFENLAIGVVEVDGLEVVPVKRSNDSNTLVYQSAFPFQEAIIIIYDQCEVVCAADTRMALWCIRPLEEGDGGTRVTDFIPKVQVIAARVVEIDRLLHKALAKYLGVEAHRALGI